MLFAIITDVPNLYAGLQFMHKTLSLTNHVENYTKSFWFFASWKKKLENKFKMSAEIKRTNNNIRNYITFVGNRQRPALVAIREVLDNEKLC